MNPLADEILDAIRACKTADQIEAVAEKYRARVVEMRLKDPARFYHVVNAKQEYMRRLNQ